MSEKEVIKTKGLKEMTSEYELEGRIPTGRAILLGMQHVLAMFVGNLTPILVIGGACSLGDRTHQWQKHELLLLEDGEERYAYALFSRQAGA